MAVTSYLVHPLTSSIFPSALHIVASVAPLNRNVVTAIRGLHMTHRTMTNLLEIKLSGSLGTSRCLFPSSHCQTLLP